MTVEHNKKTISELFVQDVMRTAGPYRHNPALAALGLCTELAELAAASYVGVEATVAEAGDVLWHVVTLLGAWPDGCQVHFVESAVDVIEGLDAVKKAIAKGETLPLDPVRDAAGYALSYEGDVDHIMLYNMAKRHKRYPSAAPEVVALLTERGYL